AGQGARRPRRQRQLLALLRRAERRRVHAHRHRHADRRGAHLPQPGRAHGGRRRHQRVPLALSPSPDRKTLVDSGGALAGKDFARPHRPRAAMTRRPPSPAPADAASDDPLWYKDAVLYELHVRGFADSDGDGIGDFRGLTGKLDYLQDLGVTALWLLPFYPSPLRDDGYDIADYRTVHPSYGTLEDFKV